MIASKLMHRIRRQRWSVQTRTAAEAMHWRQQLNADWQDTLLPAFSTAFDAAAVGERVVHIRRLELKLRADSLAQLGERLPAVLAQALADELAIHSPQQHALRQATADHLTDWASTEPWLAYLREGALPWYCAQADRQQLQQSVLPSAAQQRQLLRLALAEADDEHQLLMVFWRCLQSLPNRDWPAAIRVLFDAALPALVVLAERLAVVIGTDERLSRYQQLQWLTVALLRLWRSDGADAALRDRFERFEPGEVTLDAAQRASFWLALQRWLTHSVEVDMSVGPVDTRSLQQRRSADDVVPEPDSEFLPAPILQPHHELLQAAVAVPVTPPATSTSSIDAATVTVSHAGLLLLHPFLPQLFVSTGIIPSRTAAIPLWQLPRAAALLHFLATGSEQIAEYELGFIKLLLGLAVAAPLPVAEGLLTAADKAEADALLAAVIQHWSALKNTSINGLQLSFLQRHGLLRAEPDGWRVYIERETFDVLLDFLPWGIGVIKLPWMTDAIHTAW